MASTKYARIAIVGAGMGGLATALALAHRGLDNIVIYEAAGDLGFVGAGIQVAPNLGRILRWLGVWEYMKDDAVEMKEFTIRASATDEELTRVDLTQIQKAYGLAHCVAHRSALATALYRGCKDASSQITIHFRSLVHDVDFDNHRILVKRDETESEWVDADIILGADGVKSLIRQKMLIRHNEVAKVKDTGTAAYRIMLHRDQLKHDPNLLAMVESSTTFRWIGPRRHIIAYPISQNTIFNISTAHPDTHFASAPDTSWTTRADKSAMLDVYSDFCPTVQKLLKLAPEGNICEWKLRVHAPMTTWVEGRVALIGDACHPTLPHINQGAAQAIEDGAVLSVVLSKITNVEDIHIALLVYERLRKPRTEYLVQQAAEAGKTFHLTDPEEQAKRDAAFRQVENGGPNPDKGVDKDVQKIAYGFDCVKDAEAKFEEYFKDLKQRVIDL